eukprot:9110023-Pyramimonas_sp.AAC.1
MVDATCEGRDADGIQAQAGGWKVVIDSLPGMPVLCEMEAWLQARRKKLAAEAMIFQAIVGRGRDLSACLGGSAAQARRMVPGEFHLGHVGEFRGECDGD